MFEVQSSFVFEVHVSCIKSYMESYGCFSLVHFSLLKLFILNTTIMTMEDQTSHFSDEKSR